ncbi:MAG: helix-turn-helix domain-containing protein [bacterium]|nr:helix-turn-helix domain-containing protein [bacterium]
MKQIGFNHYPEFFEGQHRSIEELIGYYAVTGGVPKYIEVFNNKRHKTLFQAIERYVLKPPGLLYEEPIFLLEREVSEVGTYFSIIKAIANGNRKLSKIAPLLGVPQTNLTRYMQTLIDLDLVRRTVPVTASDPSGSKQGLYHITNKPVNVDLFYRLIEKGKEVKWNKKDRKEYYILFSKAGFTGRLETLATEREDLLLIHLL